MMSSYSSVFRTAVWGGIPISLAAMSVFAFLLFYALELYVSRREGDPRATAFLALATGLPAFVSIMMLTVSLVKLGTTCKLCVGIYLASAACLTGAIVLWRRAVRGGEAPVVQRAYLGGMFGAGVGFVLIPVLVYFAMAPNHARFIGSCGELAQPRDTYGVMVPLERAGRTPAIEILDPLCPACRAFEQRLDASGLDAKLDRKAILFPLDTTCNWMITENTHPGACTVSEAVLCAGDRAHEVIAWAFEVQDRIRAETKADPAAAARIVKERFPELAACVGSPDAKSRLNKSMRWAVANNLRVLTPQLFVDGVKLCDEDVDLGLDYALSRMIDGDMPARVRTAKPVEAPPAAPPVASPPAAPVKPTPAADKPTPTPPADTEADKPAPPADTEADKPAPAADKPTPEADKPITKPPTDEPSPPPSAAPSDDKPAPAPAPASAPPADEPATAPEATP
jgi:hypothetical protein